VGANLRRERATRGQPVALLIYAFPSQGTLAAYCRFLRAVGVEVEESGAGQDGAFRPPNNARLFRVTLAPATLPVRREVVCTDLRQTGPRLEPGCSERRGRDRSLRRYCRANLGLNLHPGLPVRREVDCTELRQTGQRLEPGCSERRGIRGRLRRFCLPNLPWPE
jgi:hypothetical protein